MEFYKQEDKDVERPPHVNPNKSTNFIKMDIKRSNVEINMHLDSLKPTLLPGIDLTQEEKVSIKNIVNKNPFGQNSKNDDLRKSQVLSKFMVGGKSGGNNLTKRLSGLLNSQDKKNENYVTFANDSAKNISIAVETFGYENPYESQMFLKNNRTIHKIVNQALLNKSYAAKYQQFNQIRKKLEIDENNNKFIRVTNLNVKNRFDPNYFDNHLDKSKEKINTTHSGSINNPTSNLTNRSSYKENQQESSKLINNIDISNNNLNTANMTVTTNIQNAIKGNSGKDTTNITTKKSKDNKKKDQSSKIYNYILNIFFICN